MLIKFAPVRHDVREIYTRRESWFGENEMSNAIAENVIKFLNKQFEIYKMPYKVMEDVCGEIYILDMETKNEIWQSDDEPCDLKEFLDLMNKQECEVK